ncbi:TIGR02678 family protein [Streptantibioticus ferralitis]|uniref:TIGR02678 family protein n=1 Tax=Streptantibioticus ferralitis TaxID=236510 RepID=A0ABT5ZA15_9ACTN|nr:TIGR02678 family protein [Streptantibioticus ferralitis]MDF2260508.1 TIGR02678 family protein [Streptantibioticus ferralitis]
MTDAEVQAERRRAARALLASPLMTSGNEEFRLVRKHAGELAAWFTQETGWRLVVDAETARLYKSPARLDDATRPARAPRTRVPFTRRRYVLLCLALAVLERADAQITLGRLADGVLTGAGDPVLVAAGIEFRMDRREERSDLVAVVRLLLDWGVLHRVAGDEEAYLSEASNDVLYDVRRRVLAALLAATRGPSTVETAAPDQRLTLLTCEVAPDTEELRLRALRHRLTRRLLDDPVVYYAELPEHERTYLVSQRYAITRRITELTGLVAEMRAEGIAMVDPEDELTDLRMPEQGTDGHATLLVAAHLATAKGPRTEPHLVELVRQLAVQHRSYWRKGAAEPAAAAELLAQALDRLAALDLVTREGGTVTAKPALVRYALAAPTIRKARSRA